MSNYYILVAVDTVDIKGSVLTAYQVAGQRLNEGGWPLYKHTHHRKYLTKGDKLVIYVAGSKENAQTFIASATVLAIDDNPVLRSETEKLAVEQPIYAIVKLKSSRFFERPVSIRPLLDRLTFIPDNKKRWGTVLKTGCKRLSKEDYETIVKNRKLAK